MSDTQFSENETDTSVRASDTSRNKVPLLRTSTVIAFCLGAIIGVGSVVTIVSFINNTPVPTASRVGTRGENPYASGQVPNPNAPLSGFEQPQNPSSGYNAGTFDPTIDGQEDPPPPGTEAPLEPTAPNSAN